jgi:penicillin amidase
MKGKFRRTFKIIAAVILALSLMAAGAVTGTVRKSWPQETGAIQIAGFKDKVEVVRDKWGVLHIYASNQHDLFVAQGYRPRSLLANGFLAAYRFGTPCRNVWSVTTQY